MTFSEMANATIAELEAEQLNMISDGSERDMRWQNRFYMIELTIKEKEDERNEKKKNSN